MKALLFSALLLATSARAAVPVSLDLGQNDWQFRLASGVAAQAHPAAAVWRHATVPGNVHTDLLANGAIIDPYVGAHEAELQWIGVADWEYRTTFDVAPTELARAHHDLVFDGIDTFADVYLNGKKLAATDNMFRSWRMPVQGKLKAHGNELHVVLHSPITRLLPSVQAMPHKLAGNYPSPYGDEPKDAMTQNFARKASYHYGWDWGPRYVTAGIWKPVRLESWDELRLADLHIAQDRVDRNEAALTAQIEIETDRVGEATFNLSYSETGRSTPQTLTKTVSFKRGANRIDIPVRIAEPHLWFPVGYGAQSLYTFSVDVRNASGTQARASRRTGLRRVELTHERDDKGRGFAFVINGVPVFAKGANLIPFDAFPTRVTRAQQLRVRRAPRP